MLKNLKPLVAKDVEVGNEYIAVSSAVDCSLSVTRIEVLTPYDGDGMFRSRVTYGEKDCEHSYETDQFMESLGVPHKSRRYADNHHRLFAYTPEVYDFFRDFVDKQRSVEWLLYIGVENPEDVIAKGLKEHDALMRMSDEADGMDMLAALDMFSDELTSKRVDTVKH